MMTTEEMLKKEAMRLRMANLRAKRKPPKLVNVHDTVKALSDDNTMSVSYTHLTLPTTPYV